MFRALKRKNPYEQAAQAVYATILEQVRKPVFYKEYGVPDTQSGRFDLLLMHLFIVIHAQLEKESDSHGFNQALFDITFADMDQALREIGIGDMGVPKRMRKMMKGFNGRMHAYEQAIKDKTLLREAIRRNVYADVDEITESQIRHLENYMLSSIEQIKDMQGNVINTGNIEFAEI